MAVLPPDPVFTLRQNDIGGINCVCFHGTEKLFCGTSRGTIYLWDLQVSKMNNFSSIGVHSNLFEISHRQIGHH